MMLDGAVASDSRKYVRPVDCVYNQGIVAQHAFASDYYGCLIKKLMAFAEVKDDCCWHHTIHYSPKGPFCE